MKLRKNILTVLCSAAFIASSAMPLLSQKIDKTKRPDPAPVKEFVFPKYETHTLKNGIKIILIEDHEQPTFTFRLQIPVGTAADGDKQGLAAMVSNMLTKGAGKRSALDIAQSLDGVGSSISANAAGGEAFTISASGIKKHLPLVLEILSDVVAHPTFPKEEFDKLIPQMIAEVRQEKARAGNVASALARKVAYGENHPYAKKQSEESLQSLTVKDVADFHAKYFKPNYVSLAVVGDFTAKEIIPALEKAFATWNKGDMPTVSVPPAQSMPKGVYFVERPSSVQSSIILGGMTVAYNHPDYETIGLAANVIGEGFGGRLFRTLREKYSFTYTPFGYQTNAKAVNRFSCGADVRNKVTDSTILVTQEVLKDLATNGPKAEELTLIKRSLIGGFLMSFEKSEFVAMLLQMSESVGLPFERVKGYPARINAMTAEDVKKAAEKYMNPDNLSIIVVGAKDVLPKLAQFGKVRQYDLDLKPVTEEVAEKVSISAEDLWKKHIDALGGAAAIGKLTSLTVKSELSMSAGPQTLKGNSTKKQKAGGKSTELTDMKMFKQQSWTDGAKSWSSVNGQPAEAVEGKELDDALYNAQIVPTFALKSLGWKTEVTAKKDGNFVVKATSPAGMEKTIYLDEKTFLITKTLYSQESPQGSMPVKETYSNYVDVAGVKMPQSVTQEVGPYKTSAVNSYEANGAIDDAEFSPKK